MGRYLQKGRNNNEDFGIEYVRSIPPPERINLRDTSMCGACVVVGSSDSLENVCLSKKYRDRRAAGLSTAFSLSTAL